VVATPPVEPAPVPALETPPEPVFGDAPPALELDGVPPDDPPGAEGSPPDEPDAPAAKGLGPGVRLSLLQA